MLYATGPAGLAILVRGSSRRIKIVRFRPANIRLIHRRQNLLRLLLALSSNHGKSNNNDNDKNNPTISQKLTGAISVHMRHRFTVPGSRSIAVHPAVVAHTSGKAKGSRAI